MFCSECGNKLSDGDAFCRQCGTPRAGESQFRVPDAPSQRAGEEGPEQATSSPFRSVTAPHQPPSASLAHSAESPSPVPNRKGVYVAVAALAVVITIVAAVALGGVNAGGSNGSASSSGVGSASASASAVQAGDATSSFHSAEEGPSAETGASGAPESGATPAGLSDEDYESIAHTFGMKMFTSAENTGDGAMRWIGCDSALELVKPGSYAQTCDFWEDTNYYVCLRVAVDATVTKTADPRHYQVQVTYESAVDATGANRRANIAEIELWLDEAGLVEDIQVVRIG